MGDREGRDFDLCTKRFMAEISLDMGQDLFPIGSGFSITTKFGIEGIIIDNLYNYCNFNSMNVYIPTKFASGVLLPGSHKRGLGETQSASNLRTKILKIFF